MMEYSGAGVVTGCQESDTGILGMSPGARIKSLAEIVYSSIPCFQETRNKEKEVQRLYRYKTRVESVIKTPEDYHRLKELYDTHIEELGLLAQEIEAYERDVDTGEEVREIFEEEELESREKARKKQGDIFAAYARQNINSAEWYGESSPNYAFNKLNEALLTVCKIQDTTTKFNMYNQIQELKREALDRIGPTSVITVLAGGGVEEDGLSPDITKEPVTNLGSFEDMERMLGIIENNGINKKDALGELEEIAKNLFKIERGFCGKRYNEELYKTVMGLEWETADLDHRIRF